MPRGVNTDVFVLLLGFTLTLPTVSTYSVPLFPNFSGRPYRCDM